jgi:hypothetical protein
MAFGPFDLVALRSNALDIGTPRAQACTLGAERHRRLAPTNFDSTWLARSEKGPQGSFVSFAKVSCSSGTFSPGATLYTR